MKHETFSIVALFCQFQSLLQSISDHEPDFVSLKRDGHTLCLGPSNEQGLLSDIGQLHDSSAEYVAKKLNEITRETQDSDRGQSSSPGKLTSMQHRPGQVELDSTLSDYDRRLEELKKKLRVCLSEREEQLERAREWEGLMEGMMSWLEGGVAQLDGLRVRDPSCDAIERQQQRCQVRTQLIHTMYMYMYMYSASYTMHTCTIYRYIYNDMYMYIYTCTCIS